MLRTSPTWRAIFSALRRTSRVPGRTTRSPSASESLSAGVKALVGPRIKSRTSPFANSISLTCGEVGPFVSVPGQTPLPLDTTRMGWGLFSSL